MLLLVKNGEKMKIVEIEQEQTVYGITIRTKNSNEMNPETAKIGELWESFMEKLSLN